VDFIGYRSDALGAAVALVNTVTAPAKGAGEPAADELRQVLVEHGYLAGRAPASTEPALRGWAGRLRAVFEAEDLDAAAQAVNGLLSDVEIGPHLTRHDGQGWHLHYSPPDAAVLDRVRSTTAFALAMLVSEYGLDRHGRCAAEGCARVFADTSRNAARRYCSPACANRSAVAAHRARQKQGQSAR